MSDWREQFEREAEFMEAAAIVVALVILAASVLCCAAAYGWLFPP